MLRSICLIWAALVAVAVACTSGGGGDDMPDVTGCGSGAPCLTDTQICVITTPDGPGMVYTCRPVPAGCEADRTCGCVGATVCTGTFNMCNEHPGNTVVCACPTCP